MITISASELEYYQKKTHRLELELIHAQDIIASRPIDDYKIKYELLLEKVSEEDEVFQQKLRILQEGHLKELDGLEDKINKNNQVVIKELKDTIVRLQNENGSLSDRYRQLELKLIRYQKELENGDIQIMRIKLDGVKKENQRLIKQNRQIYAQCEAKVQRTLQQKQSSIQQAKQREALCYRTQISKLEQQNQQLRHQLEKQVERNSPEREKYLRELELKINNQQQQQTLQVKRLTEHLQRKNKQIQRILEEQRTKMEVKDNLMKDLREQLTIYEQRLFEKDLSFSIQHSQTQKSMDLRRQNQADQLKKDLRVAEESFQRERSEWKIIMQQFETQNARIKQNWEEEKQKYLQQKKLLKDKIAQLRQRLKAKQNKANHQQADNFMASIKDLDMNQQHFNNYYNGITFMDRQLRKSQLKLQEKDRQINHLLQQLKALQLQSQKQISYLREKCRDDLKKTYDKIFQLQDEVDRLSEKLRDKDRQAKRKENDLAAERDQHKSQIVQVRKVIEEMERDQQRLTNNKKNVQDNYREELENVLTGKLDINQERKNKWIQLNRQKNDLEIAYRQREIQINAKHQGEMQNIKAELQRTKQERESLRAELDKLRDYFSQNHENSQQKYALYQQKLATLDLQISLTKNLFESIAKVTSQAGPRKRTQLDDLSEGESHSFNSSSSVKINIFGVNPPEHFENYGARVGEGQETPGFSTDRDEGYRITGGFSFFPNPNRRESDQY